MTGFPGPQDIFAMLASALAGGVFGWLYFRAMRHTVQRLVAGASAGAVAGLTLVRIAIAGLLALFLARWGAAMLLAAFAGFLIARTVMLRAARREA